LALQIGGFDEIAVDDADSGDPCSYKKVGGRRPDGAVGVS